MLMPFGQENVFLCDLPASSEAGGEKQRWGYFPGEDGVFCLKVFGILIEYTGERALPSTRTARRHWR